MLHSIGGRSNMILGEIYPEIWSHKHTFQDQGDSGGARTIRGQSGLPSPAH